MQRSVGARLAAILDADDPVYLDEGMELLAEPSNAVAGSGRWHPVPAADGFDRRGQLTGFESRIAAMINRLTSFNDSKSVNVSKLTAAKVAVNALMRFMFEHGLGPTAITEGERE